MRYKRRKLPGVQAFQMTADAMKNGHAWPEWLREAWLIHPDSVESIRLNVDGERFMVGREYHQSPVFEGNWILRDSNDELSVMDDAEFEEKYKRIND